MIERAAYRARQFLHALAAPLIDHGLEDVAQVLTPAQQALFLRMAPVDRRHTLAVYRDLATSGPLPHDLLVAALLHDIGKAAAPARLAVGVLKVLLERFAPRWLERLSRSEPHGWRRPFVIYRQHPHIGAEWAAQAGCSPLTVALIRQHECPNPQQDEEMSRLLALLHAADERW
ncbi:MAG: HD domain-containing protein [Anaerolineae bacterium]|nr:HD domain-containing protein [Anaerolineae bacterium]